MPYLIISLSIIFILFIYISFKYKSIVNTFLPSFYNICFALLPAIVFAYYNPNGIFIYNLSNNSYLLPSIFYLIYFIATLGGYASLNTKNTVITLKETPRINSFKVPIIGMIFIIVGFALVFNLYKQLNMRIFIDSARSFYDATRVGGGTYYFLSNILVLIGYIILLLNIKNKKIIFIITIPVILLSLVYGSKGIVLKIFLIYILFLQLRYKLSFIQNIFIIIISVVSLSALFMYYSVGIGISQIFLGMINYSDYVRNFAILINYFGTYVGSHTWGSLTWEGMIYPLIPRLLFPSKPLYFEALRIPLNFPVFKEATLLNQGAPSFGPFGVLYYDFGFLSLFLAIIIGYFKGILLCYFEKRFSYSNSLTDFLMYLVFVGLPLVAVGVGNVLIPNILLVFGVGIILKLIIGKKYIIFPYIKLTSRKGDSKSEIIN